MKPKLTYTDIHIQKLQLIHLQSKGFLRSKPKVKHSKKECKKVRCLVDSTLLVLRNVCFIPVRACESTAVRGFHLHLSFLIFLFVVEHYSIC